MKIRPFFERLALGGGVGVIATIAYRSIQALATEGADVRQTCWTWQWLPFNAEWVWPYFSMFILVGLPWFLLPDLRLVRRFALCLLGVAATGWITFLIYPTACIRPNPDGQPVYYQALLLIDQPSNCLPCLHSAFSVLAAWTLSYGAANRNIGITRALLAVWLLLIFISIVALRQHTGIDIVAGIILGSIGAWVWTPTTPRV